MGTLKPEIRNLFVQRTAKLTLTTWAGFSTVPPLGSQAQDEPSRQKCPVFSSRVLGFPSPHALPAGPFPSDPHDRTRCGHGWYNRGGSKYDDTSVLAA